MNARRSRTHRGIRNDTRFREPPSRLVPIRVLIVTEGEATEKEYFECLRAELNLGYRQVVIVNSTDGTDPMNVVKHAKKRLQRRKNFKYVYCVFDRDNQEKKYREAISEVQKMNGDKGEIEKIEAITSVPCFEFWFSLHVRAKRPKYEGMDSPCSRMERDIKSYNPFKKYSKNKGYVTSIYNSLKNKRPTALTRANSVLESAEREGEGAYYENPSTRVCVLVQDLVSISSSPDYARN